MIAEKEFAKKEKRRIKDIRKARSLEVNLGTPLAPKKPSEFNFQDVGFNFPAEIGNTVIEKKSDGFCVLFSVDDEVKIFSSNGREWNPECFPELLPGMKDLPVGYYHAEMLGSPTSDNFGSLDEYNAVKGRPKMKPPSQEVVAANPLRLDIFDTLSFEGQKMLDQPLFRRREKLEGIVQTENIGLSQQWNSGNGERLQILYNQAIQNGYEGLIAKDADSLYIPGSRDTDWLKLKEFLTLDLAVLGFYDTDESKAAGKPFASVLVGSYNPETKLYETMAKVKIPKVDDQNDILDKVEFRDFGSDWPFLLNPAMYKTARKIPDRVVTDGLAVLEIQAQDITNTKNWHSCGYTGAKAYSLRIPSFKQIRFDKSEVADVTTSAQIKEYFE